MSNASRAKSRALTASKTQTMPAQKYARKGNVVLQLSTVEGESDTVLFTGQSKIKGKDGEITIPNISAAKRYVRLTLRPKYGELRVS